jgi:hypothetical protein
MIRTALVMASLLLLAVGWLLHTANTPFVGSWAKPTLPEVDQGIPLTSIVLPTTAPITTAAEAEAVAAWWRRQPQELIVIARSLFPANAMITDGTTLYAYGCADGAQVVLFTNFQGLIGRCEFDATGVLRFCEYKPDETLPIVVPHAGGSQRRISPQAAQELAVRLLRLRDSESAIWDEGAFAESDEAPWERDGAGWARTVRTISASRDSGTTSDLRLDANGAVRDARTISWRTCYVRATNPMPQPGSSDQSTEPVLPRANN